MSSQTYYIIFNPSAKKVRTRVRWTTTSDLRPGEVMMKVVLNVPSIDTLPTQTFTVPENVMLASAKIEAADGV
jgi:hypothetical protein